MHNDRRSAPYVGLLLALLSLLGARGGAALPPGDAPRAILSAAQQAMGGEAWAGIRTLHEVGRIETGGLSGRYESWVDVSSGRYVDRFELGPATFAQGFDGTHAWSADTSGQARLDDSESAREDAANEAYRRSQSFWFPDRRHATLEDGGARKEEGRDFHVVRIAPEGGRGFEMWLDAATHRIDRIVEPSGPDTNKTFLSDFQPTAGVLIAHGLRLSNGKPAYDQKISLTAIEANVEIAPSMFALPPPPAPDFSLPEGKTSVTVPFALINNHVALDVRINDHGPVRIYCDTGGSNVLSRGLARELGVQSSGALEGAGVGEGPGGSIALAKVDKIEIGGATIRRQIFAVFDLAPLERVYGGPLPGIVGYELFKRFVVTLDYENRRMTLTLPSAFRPDGKATEVPFAFHGTKAQIRGAIDGIQGTFDIDTGSGSSLDLSRPFVEKHGLEKHYGAHIEAITGWGVGGPVRSALARVGTLTLAGFEIPGVVALLSRQTGGAFADTGISGNVGAGILRRFTLTFDYPGKRIFFTKNTSFDEPDLYDRAGMWINAAPGAFEVIDVVAGGPAAAAGLRVGDQILSVDDKPAQEEDLSKVRRQLRNEPPGTKVSLRVATSGGAPRTVVIVLRDLV